MIRKSSNPDIRILPVIALTASAIKGDRERAIEAGMVDYLAKPVKRPALESTLCKWLFDQDARQTLAKFIYDPPVSPRSKVISPRIPPPPSSANQVTWNENVQVERNKETTMLNTQGNQGTRLMASSTSHNTPQQQIKVSKADLQAVLSSSTASKIASKHGDDILKRSRETAEAATSKGGDNLSAAAVLMSARASSLDGKSINVPFDVARAIRPLMTPRSRSYGSPSSGSPASHLKASQAEEGKNDKDGSPSNMPHLIRRNSRVSRGTGRDLEGEILKATHATEGRQRTTSNSTQ